MTDEELEFNAAQVDSILSAAKLPVTAAEREWFIKHYPDLLVIKSELRLPETRYGSPVLIYSASVKLAEVSK
jgi:hypothetical protein